MWIELLMLEVLVIGTAILIILLIKYWRDKRTEPTEDDSRPSPVTNVTVEIKER